MNKQTRSLADLEVTATPVLADDGSVADTSPAALTPSDAAPTIIFRAAAPAIIFRAATPVIIL